jgi:hypothetical protein
VDLAIAFSVKAISFRKILNETYAAAKIRRDIAATAVMPRNANRGTIVLLHSDFEHRAIRAPTISSVFRERTRKSSMKQCAKTKTYTGKLEISA